jgi:hypothetical protein
VTATTPPPWIPASPRLPGPKCHCQGRPCSRPGVHGCCVAGVALY